ncbi:ABC transporter permease [Myceligenerans xiligouense]|uniref:Transport permease protein n=1 Tax=Myceligenerans xiligouense TaxID=253184 RepID=A0A3N4YUC2_9MICO|nr:ABC transporter permease [Myceligenerans xiligouense]RPF22180.1 ABC-2 type transport system permease protein [Myceligenerans xiligouense]
MTSSTHDTGRTAPARSLPLPGTVSLALVRTRVEMLGFLRERDAMIFIFAYPLIMMTIFAAVFGGQEQVFDIAAGQMEISFAQYFLPGMVATGIMLSSFQTVAISIAVERDDGTLKRLRATPLPVLSYFLGKVGQVLLVSVVQMTALIALAVLAFDVPMPEGDRWWTFAWVFVLGTATGTVTGVAFSGVPRSGRSASAVVTPVVLVLQFISGVFFPYPALPEWMQQVAQVFPLKWMAQGMRSVFLPDEFAAVESTGEWQYPLIAAVLGAWLILGLVVGVRTFRWRRRDDG